jgi:hypothetical protein
MCLCRGPEKWVVVGRRYLDLELIAGRPLSIRPISTTNHTRSWYVKSYAYLDTESCVARVRLEIQVLRVSVFMNSFPSHCMILTLVRGYQNSHKCE